MESMEPAKPLEQMEPTIPIIPMIVFDQVMFTYEEAASPAVSELHFQIEAGECAVLFGDNGSGKSTVCQLVNGLLPGPIGGKRDGQIRVNGTVIGLEGEQVHELAQQIGFVFQDPDAQLVVGRVEDEVAFGAENLCVPPAVIKERIERALHIVGMSNERSKHVNQLSGGQKQRIAIASVLTMDPTMLILDDVMSSLDPEGKQAIMQLIAALHQQGVTILLTASRADHIPACCTRQITIANGRIIDDQCGGTVQFIAQQMKGVEQSIQVEQAQQRKVAASAVERSFLTVQNLQYQYPQGSGGLAPHSFQLAAGEIVAVTGPNGVGKSTLAKLLIGILPSPQGTIWLDGRDISRTRIHERSAWIRYVHQQPEHQFIANSVWDECVYSLRVQLAHHPQNGLTERELERRGQEMLERIGLWELREQHPYQLSLGQKRLLSVASMCITAPKLLLLDEPTSGQDAANTTRTFQFCTELAQGGTAIMMITHDQIWVEPWVSRIMRLTGSA